MYNIDKANGITVIGHDIYVAYSQDVKYCIGQYKTYERAKEVFNEICNMLKPIVCMTNIKCTEELIQGLKDSNAKPILIKSGTEPSINTMQETYFEMPLE